MTITARKSWLLAAAIGLALHLVAAWATVGWFHPDEYYQTVEFAASKAGAVAPSELAYEHGERARPWLQPWIYYGVIRATRAVGLPSPADAYLACRVLMSLVGFASLLALARLAPEADRLKLHWWLMLCPFLPLHHARTSSESLAAAFLVGALFVLARGREGERAARSCSSLASTRGLLAAAFFGLAFLARYQTLVFSAGVFLWLALVKRWRPAALVQAALAFVAVAIGLGLLLDSTGYGEFTMAPYRYFDLGILRGKAAEFGTLPFWGYAPLLAGKAGIVGALVLAAVSAFFLVRHPKSAITWGTIPFVLVHCLIAHKEARFLAPLVPFLALASFPLAMTALRARWSMALAATALLVWHGVWTFGAQDFRVALLMAIVRGSPPDAVVAFNQSEPFFDESIQTARFLKERRTTVRAAPGALLHAQAPYLAFFEGSREDAHEFPGCSLVRDDRSWLSRRGRVMALYRCDPLLGPGRLRLSAGDAARNRLPSGLLDPLRQRPEHVL